MPISWIVKRQPTVAKSSTKTEYWALATVAQDIIWIRRLLAEFQQDMKSLTYLYCDYTSAIALANNPVFYARTKH